MLEDLKIDRSSKVPVSRQIAGSLRKQIFAGKLKSGDRLPTVQKLAQSLGVGSRTASEALKLLQREGLLEANPRRGTFVRDFKSSKSEAGDKKQIDTFEYLRIAVVAEKGSKHRGMGDCNLEIMKGIFGEGDRCNSVIQVFPLSIVKDSASRIFNETVNFGSQIVIWLTPSSEDYKSVEYLRSHNVPVIVVRRWSLGNGGCCVQADFNSAGFETGEKFIESGCEKVLIFDDYTKQPSGAALSIREGIAHSFSGQEGYKPERIVFKRFNLRNQPTGTNVLDELGNVGDKTGIVFCNGYGFLKLLDAEGENIRERLSGKKFAVLGSSLVNGSIIRRLKGLDFWILEEPLKTIGESAVQKALSVHKGYLDDTITLVKIKLKSFVG